MRIEGQSCMILVPRPLASCKYNEPVSYSKFSLGVHYADSSSMGVCHLPVLQRLQHVASPCFDWTGSVQAVLHMQVLWQRQLRKGHSRQQGGPPATGGDQVWLQYLVRGDRFFCRGQSRGTTFERGTVHGVTVLHWSVRSEFMSQTSKLVFLDIGIVSILIKFIIIIIIIAYIPTEVQCIIASRCEDN